MSKSTSNDEGAMELVQRSGPYSVGAGKSVGEVKVHHVDNDVESDQIASSSNSAYDDIRGMQRMGKEQQFSRNFRQLSLTAFVSLATASWEIGLFIISPALVDGGRAGLVWSSLWCWIGFAPIYLSMVRTESFKLHSPGKRSCFYFIDLNCNYKCQAKLTLFSFFRQKWPAWLQSLAHNIVSLLAGQQYTTSYERLLIPLIDWVSEFAPDKYQKFLSYLTGYERLPVCRKDVH